MKLLKVRCGDGVVPLNRHIEFPFHTPEGKPAGKMQSEFVKKVYALLKSVKIEGSTPQLKSYASSSGYGTYDIIWNFENKDARFIITLDICDWAVGVARGNKWLWHKTSKRYPTLEPSSFANATKHWVKKGEETLSMLKEV